MSTFINVRSRYLNGSSLPVKGKVTFTRSAPAQDAAGNLIYSTQPITVQLDASGFIFVTLIATNDPTLAPNSGVTYEVWEQIDGAKARKFNIPVPYTSPSGELWLADVAPAAPGPQQFQYALKSELDQHVNSAHGGNIGPAAPLGLGTTASVGSSSFAADSQHVHPGRPASPANLPLDTAAAALLGSGPAFAHWDHVHKGASGGEKVSTKTLGAIQNGSTHPLSDFYGTLAAAQAVYPAATSLSDELDWAAAQKAVDTGGPVWLAEGTPRWNKPLQRVTSGTAQALRIDGPGWQRCRVLSTVSGQAALVLNGAGSGSASTFAEDGYLLGFALTSSGAAGAIGMDMRAQQNVVFGIEISGFRAQGWRAINNNGDGDASSNCVFGGKVVSCATDGGFGFEHVEPSVSSGGSLNLYTLAISNCGKSGFAGGGMRFWGLACIFLRPIFSNNLGTSGGFVVPTGAAGGARNNIMIGPWFEQNQTRHFDMGASFRFKMIEPMFVSTFLTAWGETRAPVFGRIGSTGFVNGLKIEEPSYRIDGGANPATVSSAWDITGSNCQNLQIDELAASGTGTLTAVDSGTPGGFAIPRRRMRRGAALAGGSVYTANVTDGEDHRVVVNSAGVLTLGAPTRPSPLSGAGISTELRYNIINGSGGTVSLALNTGAAGFETPPAAATAAIASRRWLRWIWDWDSDRWTYAGHADA